MGWKAGSRLFQSSKFVSSFHVPNITFESLTIMTGITLYLQIYSDIATSQQVEFSYQLTKHFFSAILVVFLIYTLYIIR